MIDFTQVYTHPDHPGVVFRPIEHPMVFVEGGYWDVDGRGEDFWVDEFYDDEDVDWVYCRIVGDDYRWLFWCDDLTLYEGDVCPCGQINCGWGM